MDVKKFLAVLFLSCVLNCFCDNTQEDSVDNSSDEFITDIASDQDVTKGINALYTDIKPKHKVYFDNIILDYPKAEYARYDIAWLTTDKAMEFNATEGMKGKEEEYSLLLGKYGKYMLEQILVGKKLNMYWYFLKNINRGTLLGCFIIDNITYDNLEGTLRYVVATELENKGYGTKIMRIMLEKAFDEIGLYRVIGTVALENKASIRIFEKFGFVKEGILRKYYIVKGGKRIDMILFSMLKEEWEDFKKHEAERIKYAPNN